MEQEEKRLSEKISKKYHSFAVRLDDIKKDNLIQYRKEKQRLKKKFKNVLNNLHHEQKLELRRFLGYDQSIFMNSI